MSTLRNIHPQSLVSPHAELEQDVVVGPFCVVEPGVVIGRGCRLASHVVVKEGTLLGANNTICEGAVLGGVPQHVSVPASLGKLIIGANNTIREHCTLHRSLSAGETTTIGSDNLIMIGTHIAHDCRLGDHVVLTNGVMLAGHVTVGDRAFISGGVGVHQFARIGGLAMVGGHARVVHDVPPYMTMDGGTSLIVGLNVVGLRRAGYSREDIHQLKVAYRIIYRQGLTWREVVPALHEQFSGGPAAEFQRFFSGGSRGFTQERRPPPGATIRIHRELHEPEVERKVG